ncbi:hypothetical protein QBC37DRAFT_446383 [Rhypophila decipiens]|uniref:C2H2-type domain-containing protein n=1 Tax=Rhypophila decipiens TaxID=261697 RepID=A0AAN6Y367_9PEZI|nr:hypothetical protein QBC37DRAFT_446383 [Rhypophila decipiens]
MFVSRLGSSPHLHLPILLNTMDYRPISRHGTAPDEKPIPLGSKVLHKFYEPVILLVSLMDAVSSNPSIASISEATGSSNRDTGTSDIQPIQVFKAFVNKLSHVCSSSKGPKTVTSFIILRDRPSPGYENGRVHYWFAANEQTTEKLADTQAYVQKLLKKVCRAPLGSHDQEGCDAARKDIHRDVLVFNRRRITTYLGMIQDQTAKCLERLAAEENDHSRALSSSLRDLVDPDHVGESRSDPESDFIAKVQRTIRQLMALEKSQSYPSLLTRAEQGRLMTGSTQACFSDFIHTSKRILAYPQSVQHILTVARPKWPELFDSEPLVSFLPSSKPLPAPSRVKSLSAESMVGRMTRKEKEITRFREFVKRLQVFDLDARIRDEYKKDSFTPRVHSEVLLLDWVWQTFAVDCILPSGKSSKVVDSNVFFNGWMYIGSSKPTCRLCHYYFEERKSGVQHREDWHGNLYPAWAFPEVFPSQGEAAMEDRQVMVDRVLQRVRKDAFEVVRKKVAPRHKEEDSNTFSEAITLDDRWTILSQSDRAVDVDVDEITSMLGEMSTENVVDELDLYDGDNDDNGGAALF